MDRDGIKLLLSEGEVLLPRLPQPWLDTAYNGSDKCKYWVRKELGWMAKILQHPSRIALQEVINAWTGE
jgi:hypothetical protein